MPTMQEVAAVNEEMTRVECSHCGYGDGYEEYLEVMKNEAVNMAADYIPDRPGM